jgi:hypothetical protein
MNKKVIFKTYRGQLSKGTQNKNSEETTEGNSNSANFYNYRILSSIVCTFIH